MFWPAKYPALPAPWRRFNIALRRALGAHAPAMLWALGLPAASMLLGDSARDLYLMALEACIASATILHLWMHRSGLRGQGSARALQWALVLAGLGGADLIYNLPGPLVPRYPRNHVADLMLVGVVALLTALALRGWQRRHGPGAMVAVWLLAMGALQLQVTYVLQPLMQLQHVPALAVLDAWIYAALSAFLMALLLTRSSRAIGQGEHLAAQGLLLMLVSDFAQRHDALMTAGAMGWGEAGWAAGLGLLAVALTSGRGELPWRASSPQAAWRSARCALGGLTFAGNAVLLGGAIIGGLLQITKGAQLTALLWLVWIGWFVSNALALRLHEAMERIGALMPAPHITWCHAQHPMRVALKPITPRTRLAEFDGWVARYNQLARQLNPLIAQASRHQEALVYQQMAEHVAHDIRAPIAALQSALDALGGREAQSATMLRDAADRIHDVAQTLLRARRLQGHTSEPPEGPKLSAESRPHAPLSSAAAQEAIPVARALEIVQRDLALRHGGAWAAAVVYDIETQWVQAPLTALVTILCNLLDNSIEATACAPGAVRIEARRQHHMVRFRVIDRGTGMPEQVLHALGHRSVTAGKRDGNGLGVLGAAHTARSLGGALRFQLPPEGGTTAELLLPWAQAPAASSSPAASLPPGPPEQAQRVPPETTILVDDDPLVRAAWQLSAQHAHTKLFTFATSDACLQALHTLDPACSFYLDTQLGGAMTGHDLAEVLLTRGYSRVTVMQSTGGGALEQVRARAQYPIVSSKRAPFAARTHAA